VSPVRQFFATFTRDQTDQIREIVRTGQGLDLITAIESSDDNMSVYYLRKFARSLDPDQIDALKRILSRQQIAAFMALTGLSV